MALIAATVLASMGGFLDANVVNVAVPAIGRDLSRDHRADDHHRWPVRSLHTCR
ncbi:hypothetical protein [Micromonospora thermarum]|uniref:Uncharacterized protein n=1 Tax=Micromonospora thermarum TaxID=2720024 RepID=A0ABX0ZJ33_9ACTN|nr:hypothetical protein [Micromonospora thermarum]NJP35835.1 hypothetical protein [Micromonospora thermarum]